MQEYCSRKSRRDFPKQRAKRINVAGVVNGTLALAVLFFCYLFLACEGN